MKKIKSRNDFIKLQNELKKPQEKTYIAVGMATCGNSAGAGGVFDIIKNGISDENIKIIPVGCSGACYAEPIVEIRKSCCKPIIYENVDEKMARKIIEDLYSLQPKI